MHFRFRNNKRALPYVMLCNMLIVCNVQIPALRVSISDRSLKCNCTWSWLITNASSAHIGRLAGLSTLTGAMPAHVALSIVDITLGTLVLAARVSG